jgi:hypothetical protein
MFIKTLSLLILISGSSQSLAKPKSSIPFDSNIAKSRHTLSSSLNKNKCTDGNDFIDGSVSKKSVSFIGERNEYHITRFGDGSFVVKDLIKCRSGEDTVLNIPKFIFNKESILITDLIPERYVSKFEKLHTKYTVSIDAEKIKKTCGRGLFVDCHKLGSMFANGFADSGKDWAKAAKYYSKACLGGVFNSCSQAANAFINSGRPMRNPDSYKYLKIACDKGDFQACNFKNLTKPRLTKNEKLAGKNNSSAKYRNRRLQGKSAPRPARAEALLKPLNTSKIRAQSPKLADDVIKLCTNSNKSLQLNFFKNRSGVMMPHSVNGKIIGLKMIGLDKNSPLSPLFEKNDIAQFIDLDTSAILITSENIFKNADCLKIQKADKTKDIYRKLAR